MKLDFNATIFAPGSRADAESFTGAPTMRIALIAPLYEAVPPKLLWWYRTGRLVPDEELVALGHDVTLFASGDSVTRRSSTRHGHKPCGWIL